MKQLLLLAAAVLSAGWAAREAIDRILRRE